MEMIQGQLMYVAASFVEGVFLMFLYDFIRAFRMKVKHGRVWILIEMYSRCVECDIGQIYRIVTCLFEIGDTVVSTHVP